MPNSALSEAEVLACLENLLASSTFAQADRLRTFLRFVVERSFAGDASSLKETVIGVEVFGREPGYDPKTDNIVRTAARRVRSKLDDYYASGGSDDRIRIALPKGSYVAVFKLQASSPPLAAEAQTPITDAAVPGHWKLVLSGVCACAVALFGWTFLKHSASAAHWHSVPFISSSGYETFPAFSPDGTRVAFTWEDPKKGSRRIYVQVVGSQSLQLVTASDAEQIRPAWSPDGRQIAFVQLGAHGQKDVYTVTSDGRNARRLAALSGSGLWLCDEPRLSWSSDGAELAAVEKTDANQACGVVLINAKSGGKRILTLPPNEVLGDVEPAFSPDGRSLAYLRQSSASIGDIFVIPVSGDRPHQVTSDQAEIRGFSWASDGKSLIVCSRRQGSFLNLWQMPLESGSPLRLTESPVNLGFPIASKSGDRIAYVAYLDDLNIWRSRGSTHEALIQSRTTDWFPRYSPDGRQIAFCSDRAGNMDLWIADADGHNAVPVTHFAPSPVGTPAWSPDGTRLAIDVRIGGQSHVFLVSAQPDQKPHRLTSWNSNEEVASWSPDGAWVYFASSRSGNRNVYRASVNGGDPVQVTQGGAFRALESADGRFLYYTRNAKGIWRLPMQSEAKEQAVLPDFPTEWWADWTLGNGGIYYLEHDAAAGNRAPATIDFYNPDRKAIRHLCRTEKAPANSGGLSVAPDGKSFLYSQRDYSGSDILLLEH